MFTLHFAGTIGLRTLPTLADALEIGAGYAFGGKLVEVRDEAGALVAELELQLGGCVSIIAAEGAEAEVEAACG